jgi:hypothetical protein
MWGRWEMMGRPETIRISGAMGIPGAMGTMEMPAWLGNSRG